MITCGYGFDHDCMHEAQFRVWADVTSRWVLGCGNAVAGFPAGVMVVRLTQREIDCWQQADLGRVRS